MAHHHFGARRSDGKLIVSRIWSGVRTTRQRLIVDCEPFGWGKLCCTQNIAPCAGVTKWRVRRRGRGYVATGYYCDDHLPDEAVDAIEIDEDD